MQLNELGIIPGRRSTHVYSLTAPGLQRRSVDSTAFFSAHEKTTCASALPNHSLKEGGGEGRGAREKEKQTDKTDRQIETERKTETATETERQTETERNRDRDSERQRQSQRISKWIFMSCPPLSHLMTIRTRERPTTTTTTKRGGGRPRKQCSRKKKF